MNNIFSYEKNQLFFQTFLTKSRVIGSVQKKWHKSGTKFLKSGTKMAQKNALLLNTSTHFQQ